MSRNAAYWLCQGLGWSLMVGLSLAGRHLSGRPVDLSGVVEALILLALAMVTTHLSRAVIRRGNWLRLPPLQIVPRLLGMVLMVSLAALAAGEVIARLWPLEPERGHDLAACLFILINWIFIFLIWHALYFGVHLFQESQRARLEKWQLEAAVKEAELKALKAQLNPHFLFNSLNGLRGLIVEDPARAQRAVTQLASLLRYALKANESTVPLEQELSIVRSCLELESLRLEERLSWSFEIGKDASDAPVPPMLLQSLVENGIKHGVSLLPKGGSLAVGAKLENDCLQLTVRNSADALCADPEGGLGLHNASARLKLLFGDEATLRLFSPEPGTVTAVATIPLGRRL